MRRREAVRTGVLLGVGGAAGLAGCTSPSADPTFYEGFEGGIDEWTTGAAIGPEVPLSEFERSVDASDERASAGERSLRVFTEGDHDDGTAWAVRPIDVEPGRAYTADVSARFWSESESFNTLRDAVMRLGPAPPETESDFPHPGLSTTPLGETPYGGVREPLWLAEGWREYGFEWATPTLSTDTLHVAVGVSVIWEADVTHFVDELSVDLTPR